MRFACIVKLNGEAAEKPVRKVNLPFSEADLLKGLNAHGAHADEIAAPSSTGADSVIEKFVE
ncbi:MAG: hypothetical protein CME36_17430 [unclassified Hahellaceae]|nr:hypothetical protein [Hahellaceae bacterium]